MNIGQELYTRRDILAYSTDSYFEVQTLKFNTAIVAELPIGSCVNADGTLVVAADTQCFVVADHQFAGAKFLTVFDRLVAVREDMLKAFDAAGLTKAKQLIVAADKIRLV